MNKIYQTLTVTGANLLALGIAEGNTTQLKPIFSNSHSADRTLSMSESDLRLVEANHLEIYAACKWGRAAFDPVQVESEEISPQVRSIYDQMG